MKIHWKSIYDQAVMKYSRYMRYILRVMEWQFKHSNRPGMHNGANVIERLSRFHDDSVIQIRTMKNRRFELISDGLVVYSGTMDNFDNTIAYQAITKRKETKDG